jgi:hypothetical protein
MGSKQGDLSLLKDPVAQRLLQSTIPARLAYVWKGRTPRVVPIWFHWSGEEFVFTSSPKAPKLKALTNGSNVALTIDDSNWPYKVLMIRGTVSIQMVQGIPAEYEVSAKRYLGEEQGMAWIGHVRGIMPSLARIAVRPEWVGILDFQTRFPSAFGGA